MVVCVVDSASRILAPLSVASGTDPDSWLVIGGLALAVVTLVVGVAAWRDHRGVDVNDRATQRSDLD